MPDHLETSTTLNLLIYRGILKNRFTLLRALSKKNPNMAETILGQKSIQIFLEEVFAFSRNILNISLQLYPWPC